jgi:hypothetical protein
MTLSELLAKSVLQAQERTAELITQTREKLIARRDELRRAEHLPVDAAVLERQRLELEKELETLSAETENMEARCVELKEVLLRRVETTWAYLSEQHRAQAEEVSRFLVAEVFQSAMTEYASELASSGLDLEQATSAQLRERLPLLRVMGDELRASARKRAESASQKLATSIQLQQKRLELEERRRNLKHALEQILTRLRSHSRSADQIQLVKDILVAKESVLQRLRQEILEPLLNEARLEREKGLIGTDPLEQVTDVYRNPNA